MRGSHLRKFLKTLDLLSRPNGASIAELMEELELDRSGVYRHLEFVQELGFPVYDDKEPCGRKVRKKLMDGYLRKLPNMNIPDVVLKPSEIIALYLLKGEGQLFRDTEIANSSGSRLALILFVPYIIKWLSKYSSPSHTSHLVASLEKNSSSGIPWPPTSSIFALGWYL